MKAPLEQGTLSNTSEGKINLNSQIQKKNLLFNHTDKLAADHNVTVSNTMIKVTYNKALKNHFASTYSSELDSPQDLIIIENNMNMSDIYKKKTGGTINLCNSEISIVHSSVKPQNIAKPGPMCHSTPKPQAVASEKKREYINGLNLSIKQNTIKNNSVLNLSKVQNTSVNKLSGSSTPRKKSLNTGKPSSFSFLGNVNLVKVKDSIISKNGAVSKPKKPEVEIRKLENGMKPKVEANVRKRKKVEILGKKSSKTDIYALTKKIKLSENNSKEVRCSDNLYVEELNRSGINKKAIMLVDPELPSGWSRFIRTKNKGSANEQHIVYVVSPQGKKFRFKWKLRKFLEKTNSPLDADQFFFGLYKRPKSSNVPPGERDESKFESKSTKNASLSKISMESSSASGADRSSSGETAKRAGKVLGPDGKELLLFDPDLPFGWKRIIHSNTSTGRMQVHIISPEGKIFRRRYRLYEYLTKHQYSHSLDRFYFGLYPKKDGNGMESESQDGKDGKMLSGSSDGNDDEEYSSDSEYEEGGEFITYEGDMTHLPLYNDPNLPKGWKRFIKIRGYGETAGRMEVVIVSPDGKKHRCRGHLEHYIQQQNLDLKAEDFDFTVFGKSNMVKKRPAPAEVKDPTFGMKKKFQDKPVPPLDISSLKDIKITPEGKMINTVTGLMMSCGLATARSERRLRVPRNEHEKIIKNHLNSEGEVSSDGCHIPKYWIERLLKCRSDFRVLESDALSTIAERTKEFIKELSLRALAGSENPERGLLYEDLAEVVNESEALSPLQTLIPKKTSYREYIRLNRPKQYLSFT